MCVCLCAVLHLPDHVLYVCVVTALGFSKGAPFSTCLTMFPKHGHTERQEGPPPFFLTLSPDTYRPGQIVTGEGGVDVQLH